MTTENSSLYRVLIKIFVIILLLFLCSIPVFYLTVFLSVNGREFSNVYIVARGLRFFAVILIGCVMRKRYKEILTHSGSLRKKFMNIIMGLFFVSIWFHYDNTTDRLYHAISDIVGVSNLETTPLFLSILWEQLFAGDLYWSVLICLLIVFVTFRLSAKHKLQKDTV